MAVAWITGGGLIAARALGYERYVIAGGSMTGSFDRGSLVLARPEPVAALRAGDVITYMPPPETGIRRVITHRVVAVGAPRAGWRTFRTRGDANAATDPWSAALPEGATVARARIRVPLVGWIFAALGVRWLRMLLIGGPALWIAARAAAGLRRPVPAPA